VCVRVCVCVCARAYACMRVCVRIVQVSPTLSKKVYVQHACNLICRVKLRTSCELATLQTGALVKETTIEMQKTI